MRSATQRPPGPMRPSPRPTAGQAAKPPRRPRDCEDHGYSRLARSVAAEQDRNHSRQQGRSSVVMMRASYRPFGGSAAQHYERASPVVTAGTGRHRSMQAEHSSGMGRGECVGACGDTPRTRQHQLGSTANPIGAAPRRLKVIDHSRPPMTARGHVELHAGSTLAAGRDRCHGGVPTGRPMAFSLMQRSSARRAICISTFRRCRSLIDL